ncbi:CoA-binding domain protein [Campylobacter iguaniorum]|uniref:CoA-binding protein n=1 Tax=Campylobacter iguaniorum TaxID=1244531 RepID=UPI0007C8BBDC|nr:CoA-binding protein [Campylobacter iguaniorum]ANE35800.1 CoA-binding domain protein [Campylobacter iguaniorum]
MNKILSSMKNIAVVGFSPDESKDSNKVGKYLIDQGFNVYPIYPKDGQIYGKSIYKSLSDVNEPIDTVVMFRKGEFATTLIDEVISVGAINFWLQLGIINDDAKEKAVKNGINFVQNACIMVEHKKENNGKFK